MPELPEVEVVRLGLLPAVSGATVAAVTVFDERSLRRHDGPAEDFVDRLTGAQFTGAERRGKFLWLPIAASAAAAGDAAPNTPTLSTSTPKEALVVHLGMSGQVLLRTREQDDRLTRIRLDIEHPVQGPLRLNFVDQRIFGSMALDALVPSGGLPTADPPTADPLTADLPGGAIPSQVAHIARDPLDPLFDDALFASRLGKRKTGIKRAILDQTLISGIGNIYADEALWAARLHYDQPTATLPRAKVTLLLAEVRSVLRKALAEGGTSFDAQYVNVNGASGYFSHSLNVYGQQGKECPRCGREVKREQFMNRGSHFCPWCQRVR
jgi:formamidopyrimidine-DNA glycosylase